MKKFMNNWHIKNIGGRLLMAAMGALCLVGCDVFRILDGLPVKYQSECGEVEVSAIIMSQAPFHVSAGFQLNGEYTIQPDSLRFYVHHKAVKDTDIKITLFHNGMHEVKRPSQIVKGDKGLVLSISMTFDWQPGDTVDIDTCYMAFLPSDFIMCNGKRIIADTIRFKFTEPPKQRR